MLFVHKSSIERCRKQLAWLLAACLLPALLWAAGPSDQVVAPPQKQPIALVGGTIHPVSGPVLENAVIVFDRGKITALGANVAIPADALKIEITGKHVWPGLIEATSSLGLVEIGAVSATRDVAEIGAINPSVRAEVAINPDSEHFPVTRANGVALAVTMPSGGVIAGKAALLQLDGWTWEDMTKKAPVGMVINWPRMSIFHGFSFFRVPSPAEQRKQRQKNLDALAEAFRSARAYKKARQAAATGAAPAPAFDARWDALLPVLDGELPVWINANDIRQIRAAVDWASREKVKMVLVGGSDAYLVTDLLRRKNIPVIVRSTLRLPTRRDEGFDAPFALPRKLYEAGIMFCISGGRTGHERHLAHQAAKAASYGLPVEEALKAVTLYPAQIIGAADRVGSLEVGKDATLIVTDGNPLELVTNVEKLYIDGRDVDLGNKHRTLYEKYREKYRQRGYLKGTKD